MSEQLKSRVAAGIQTLAEANGATTDAVASQADLMGLGCVVAEATDQGRRTLDLDVVAGVAVLLLEEAANSLEEFPQGATVPNRAVAARAALGLEPGTQGKPLRGRRGAAGRVETIARWLAYKPASLFKLRQDGRSPFGALITDMAEYVVRREVAHLVTEQRLVQQARRPPLESAMRVDWLPRFEEYYAIWSYIAGLRYDVELATSNTSEAGDEIEADFFVRKSLWHYACFVRELEAFNRRRGGLWVMPNPAAEQTIADAVWLLRKPTPMTELDDSVLRLAIAGCGEMALFIQATHSDTALRGLVERWATWIRSCTCPDPKDPSDTCPVHLCTKWAAAFMNALDRQWDLLADWYDVPRPPSLVDPPELATLPLPSPPT